MRFGHGASSWPRPEGQTSPTPCSSDGFTPEASLAHPPWDSPASDDAYAAAASYLADSMNLFWAALIVVLVAAVATTAMLLVRRRAPAGSYFEDGDRAAGVFGVLATGFAVLLGFVVFLAFESFDTSRSGAETEAEVVREQFETAQLFPLAVRGRLSGELVCYARSVVHQEWPQMESGSLGEALNPWGISMFRTLK